MFKTITGIVFLTFFIMINSCGLSEDTVAKVGNQEIKVDEFVQELQKRYPNKESFTDVDSTAKMRILNSMIDQKRKLAAAYEMGLDENEDVRTKLENQKNSMLFSKYYESMVVDSVIDLDAFEKAMNNLREQVEASHILIKFKGSPGAPVERTKEEAEALARSLAERVRNGESINELAKEYSEDPSANQNSGNLGYFTWGRMVESFQEAAYNLEPGEVSDPVLSNYGYHVIKVTDRRDNPSYDPDNLGADTYRIKRGLFSKVSSEGVRRWRELSDRNREKYNFKIIDENVDKFVSIANEKKEAKKMQPGDYAADEKNIVLAEFDGGEVTAGDVFELYNRRFRGLLPKLTDADKLSEEIKNAGNLAIGRKIAQNMNLDNHPDVQNVLKDSREREMLSLINKEVVKEVSEIPEDELLDYYNQHSDQYMKKAEMEIWEIFTKDQSTAKRVVRMAKNGQDFEELAEKYNESKSSQNKKGYLGFQAENRRGKVSKKAFEVGPNQIAGPVEYRKGWAVIKTGELNPESPKPFSEVQKQIEQKIKNERTTQRRNEWEQEIKEEYQAKINYKLLENI